MTCDSSPVLAVLCCGSCGCGVVLGCCHGLELELELELGLELSACSFPSRSTCDGTLTHSCAACLCSSSSSICCHKSIFLIACPFFVFHPLLFQPSSHSVAPSVTSCESTQSCSSVVRGASFSTSMAAVSSALLLVRRLPCRGALNFRACPSPNQAPYPAYCFPSTPVCWDPSVHTL